MDENKDIETLYKTLVLYTTKVEPEERVQTEPTDTRKCGTLYILTKKIYKDIFMEILKLSNEVRYLVKYHSED